MAKKETSKTLIVQEKNIRIVQINQEDYISITDIVKAFGDEIVMYNWLRNRNTIEFIGTWELLYNPNFKTIEFDRFKTEAGLNSFTLSPKKWIDATDAIGIVSKAGRYGGGVFAHSDIALEFCSWLNPVFKLYLIKEFQRLKKQEGEANIIQTDWDLKRTLAKINYRIHTDAIKENLIPQQLGGKQTGFIYAGEADVLNVALFGITASVWRANNPDQKGNIRDYASAEQLVVLSNLESINALLIQSGMEKEDRLLTLNDVAIKQMTSLLGYQNGLLEQKNPKLKP